MNQQEVINQLKGLLAYVNEAPGSALTLSKDDVRAIETVVSEGKWETIDYSDTSIGHSISVQPIASFSVSVSYEEK
jgi:hypothetical protein